MTKLEKLLSREGVFIGAHRGFSGVYPENTLLAVSEAVNLNVDLIEVDVYTTKDGVPVVCHDYNLARCSNGTGLVSDHTLAELKKLDFGVHRGPQFEGLTLPTVEQFLDSMKPHEDILLDIDFKVTPDTVETVKSVMPLLERTNFMERCVFNCVDCNIVDYVTERWGKRVISAPHDWPWIENFKPGKDGSLSRMWGICIPYNMLDDNHVNMYRDLGIALVCTPADTPEQVKKAMDYGVLLPLCNDPRAYLRANGR